MFKVLKKDNRKKGATFLLVLLTMSFLFILGSLFAVLSFRTYKYSYGDKATQQAYLTAKTTYDLLEEKLKDNAFQTQLIRMLELAVADNTFFNSDNGKHAQLFKIRIPIKYKLNSLRLGDTPIAMTTDEEKDIAGKLKFGESFLEISFADAEMDTSTIRVVGVYDGYTSSVNMNFKRASETSKELQKMFRNTLFANTAVANIIAKRINGHAYISNPVRFVLNGDNKFAEPDDEGYSIYRKVSAGDLEGKIFGHTKKVDFFNNETYIPNRWTEIFIRRGDFLAGLHLGETQQIEEELFFFTGIDDNGNAYSTTRTNMTYSIGSKDSPRDLIVNSDALIGLIDTKVGVQEHGFTTNNVSFDYGVLAQVADDTYLGVSGNVYVNGNARLENLKVKGDTFIAGSAVIDGNMGQSNPSSSSIWLNGDLYVGGNLYINNANINGNVYVRGKICDIENVRIGGNVYVLNDADSFEMPVYSVTGASDKGIIDTGKIANMYFNASGNEYNKYKFAAIKDSTVASIRPVELSSNDYTTQELQRRSSDNSNDRAEKDFRTASILNNGRKLLYKNKSEFERYGNSVLGKTFIGADANIRGSVKVKTNLLIMPVVQTTFNKPSNIKGDLWSDVSEFNILSSEINRMKKLKEEQKESYFLFSSPLYQVDSEHLPDMRIGFAGANPHGWPILGKFYNIGFKRPDFDSPEWKKFSNVTLRPNHPTEMFWWNWFGYTQPYFQKPVKIFGSIKTNANLLKISKAEFISPGNKPAKIEQLPIKGIYNKTAPQYLSLTAVQMPNIGSSIFTYAEKVIINKTSHGQVYDQFNSNIKAKMLLQKPLYISPSDKNFTRLTIKTQNKVLNDIVCFGNVDVAPGATTKGQLIINGKFHANINGARSYVVDGSIVADDFKLIGTPHNSYKLTVNGLIRVKNDLILEKAIINSSSSLATDYLIFTEGLLKLKDCVCDVGNIYAKGNVTILDSEVKGSIYSLNGSVDFSAKKEIQTSKTFKARFFILDNFQMDFTDNQYMSYGEGDANAKPILVSSVSVPATSYTDNHGRVRYRAKVDEPALALKFADREFMYWAKYDIKNGEIKNWLPIDNQYYGQYFNMYHKDHRIRYYFDKKTGTMQLNKQVRLPQKFYFNDQDEYTFDPHTNQYISETITADVIEQDTDFVAVFLPKIVDVEKITESKYPEYEIPFYNDINKINNTLNAEKIYNENNEFVMNPYRLPRVISLKTNTQSYEILEVKWQYSDEIIQTEGTEKLKSYVTPYYNGKPIKIGTTELIKVIVNGNLVEKEVDKLIELKIPVKLKDDTATVDLNLYDNTELVNTFRVKPGTVMPVEIKNAEHYKDGKVFVGWFSSNGGIGAEFKPGYSIIVKATNLYAHYRELNIDPSSNKDLIDIESINAVKIRKPSTHNPNLTAVVDPSIVIYVKNITNVFDSEDKIRKMLPEYLTIKYSNGKVEKTLVTNWTFESEGFDTSVSFTSQEHPDNENKFMVFKTTYLQFEIRYKFKFTSDKDQEVLAVGYNDDNKRISLKSYPLNSQFVTDDNKYVYAKYKKNIKKFIEYEYTSLDGNIGQQVADLNKHVLSEHVSKNIIAFKAEYENDDIYLIEPMFALQKVYYNGETTPLEIQLPSKIIFKTLGGFIELVEIDNKLHWNGSDDNVNKAKFVCERVFTTNLVSGVNLDSFEFVLKNKEGNKFTINDIYGVGFNSNTNNIPDFKFNIQIRRKARAVETVNFVIKDKYLSNDTVLKDEEELIIYTDYLDSEGKLAEPTNIKNIYKWNHKFENEWNLFNKNYSNKFVKYDFSKTFLENINAFKALVGENVITEVTSDEYIKFYLMPILKDASISRVINNIAVNISIDKPQNSNVNPKFYESYDKLPITNTAIAILDNGDSVLFEFNYKQTAPNPSNVADRFSVNNYGEISKSFDFTYDFNDIKFLNTPMDSEKLTTVNNDILNDIKNKFALLNETTTILVKNPTPISNALILTNIFAKNDVSVRFDDDKDSAYDAYHPYILVRDVYAGGKLYLNRVILEKDTVSSYNYIYTKSGDMEIKNSVVKRDVLSNLYEGNSASSTLIKGSLLIGNVIVENNLTLENTYVLPKLENYVTANQQLEIIKNEIKEKINPEKRHWNNPTEGPNVLYDSSAGKWYSIFDSQYIKDNIISHAYFYLYGGDNDKLTVDDPAKVKIISNNGVLNVNGNSLIHGNIVAKKVEFNTDSIAKEFTIVNGSVITKSNMSISKAIVMDKLEIIGGDVLVEDRSYIENLIADGLIEIKRGAVVNQLIDKNTSSEAIQIRGGGAVYSLYTGRNVEINRNSGANDLVQYKDSVAGIIKQSVIKGDLIMYNRATIGGPFEVDGKKQNPINNRFVVNGLLQVLHDNNKIQSGVFARAIEFPVSHIVDVSGEIIIIDGVKYYEEQDDVMGNSWRHRENIHYGFNDFPYKKPEVTIVAPKGSFLTANRNESWHRMYLDNSSVQYNNNLQQFKPKEALKEGIKLNIYARNIAFVNVTPWHEWHVGARNYGGTGSRPYRFGKIFASGSDDFGKNIKTENGEIIHFNLYDGSQGYQSYTKVDTVQAYPSASDKLESALNKFGSGHSKNNYYYLTNWAGSSVVQISDGGTWAVPNINNIYYSVNGTAIFSGNYFSSEPQNPRSLADYANNILGFNSLYPDTVNMYEYVSPYFAQKWKARNNNYTPSWTKLLHYVDNSINSNINMNVDLLNNILNEKKNTYTTSALELEELSHLDTISNEQLKFENTRKINVALDNYEKAARQDYNYALTTLATKLGINFTEAVESGWLNKFVYSKTGPFTWGDKLQFVDKSYLHFKEAEKYIVDYLAIPKKWVNPWSEYNKLKPEEIPHIPNKVKNEIAYNTEDNPYNNLNNIFIDGIKGKIIDKNMIFEKRMVVPKDQILYVKTTYDNIHVLFRNGLELKEGSQIKLLGGRQAFFYLDKAYSNRRNKTEYYQAQTQDTISPELMIHKKVRIGDNTFDPDGQSFIGSDAIYFISSEPITVSIDEGSKTDLTKVEAFMYIPEGFIYVYGNADLILKGSFIFKTYVIGKPYIRVIPRYGQPIPPYGSIQTFNDIIYEYKEPPIIVNGSIDLFYGENMTGIQKTESKWQFMGFN